MKRSRAPVDRDTLKNYFDHLGKDIEGVVIYSIMMTQISPTVLVKNDVFTGGE